MRFPEQTITNPKCSASNYFKTRIGTWNSAASKLVRLFRCGKAAEIEHC
jgi:hypothetical protein